MTIRSTCSAQNGVLGTCQRSAILVQRRQGGLTDSLDLRRAGVAIGTSQKAAVLAVRIAKNHPLPDGNERLAWQSMTMSCTLNGYDLEVPADEAATLMLGIAGGELDEAAVSKWLIEWIGTAE